MEEGKSGNTAGAEFFDKFRQELEEIREIVAKIDPFGPQSNQGKEWATFAVLVGRHIEGYTVPQYGARGLDEAQRGLLKIARYCAMESGARGLDEAQRGLDEAQRGLLKIAHYCAMLFFKRMQ